MKTWNSGEAARLNPTKLLFCTVSIFPFNSNYKANKHTSQSVNVFLTVSFAYSHLRTIVMISICQTNVYFKWPRFLVNKTWNCIVNVIMRERKKKGSHSVTRTEGKHIQEIFPTAGITQKYSLYSSGFLFSFFFYTINSPRYPPLPSSGMLFA